MPNPINCVEGKKKKMITSEVTPLLWKKLSNLVGVRNGGMSKPPPLRIEHLDKGRCWLPVVHLYVVHGGCQDEIPEREKDVLGRTEDSANRNNENVKSLPPPP